MKRENVIVALATIRARLELFGERLVMQRVPIGMIGDLGLIVRAVEKLEEELKTQN